MPDESIGGMLYTAMKKETLRKKRERTRRLAEASLQEIAVEQQTATEELLAAVRTAIFWVQEGMTRLDQARMVKMLRDAHDKAQKATGFR